MQSRIVVWVTEDPGDVPNVLVEPCDHLYAVDVWCGTRAERGVRPEHIWRSGWPPPQTGGTGPGTRVVGIDGREVALERLRAWTCELPEGVGVDLVLDGPLSAHALWAIAAWLCVERPGDRLRIQDQLVEVPRLRRLLPDGSASFLAGASYEELMRATRAGDIGLRARLHRRSRGWTYCVFDEHGDQCRTHLSDVLGAALYALVLHPGAPADVVIEAASTGEVGWPEPPAVDCPERQARRVSTWATRLRQALREFTVRGLTDFVPALQTRRIAGPVDITFDADLPWSR